MAKLKGDIQFTGSLGEHSAYKRRGTDGIILRKKGGASKERIQIGPEFARTRENNAEWGGASSGGKNVRVAMNNLRHLGDPNVTGKLTALSMAILRLDLVHSRGKRPVQYSAHKYLFEGFNLNDLKPFDSIVRQPVNYSLSRDICKATIQLPNLIPGLNFFPLKSLPMFRFIIQLGIVPDMVYGGENTKYRQANTELKLSKPCIYTDFFPTAAKFIGQSLEINIPDNNLDETGTLLLSIGIEYGKIDYDNEVGPIKYAGAAKVLGVA